MNMEGKVDWVGTPRQHSYEENGITHKAISIDFTIAQDDTRYKLVIQTIVGENKTTRYEIKQYGVKPGKQKPFLLDTNYVFENETNALIDSILRDPYVQHFL